MQEMFRQASYIICLLLVVITVVAFYQVAGHQFLTFDDGEYVTDNPNVIHGLSGRGIIWAFKSFHASNWHPVTWISHMIDASIFGKNAAGPHLVNLAFHIANTILLFLLFARMTGFIWRSAFVAALFAVHPLHVESVAWVAERKDVLSTFFWLLTMWAYLRYAKLTDDGLSRKGLAYTVTIFLFALGLMAKPMLVTLPFVLLLMDYWPLGRWSKKSWKSLVEEKLPLFGMSVASSIVTCIAQRAEAMSTLSRVPLGARLSNALVSYVAYILKMLWPHKLAAIYPHPGNTLPIWQPCLAGILLAGITVIAFRNGKRYPYLVTGWCWYLVTLVPVVGIIQVGAQAMADRYTYVPLIGLFLLLAWALSDLVMKKPASGLNEPKRMVEQTRSIAHFGFLALCACIVLVTLVIRTWVQVSYWHDTARLFRHALSVTRNNYLAHSFLGATLAISGEYDEAIRHLKASIRIAPNYAEGHSDLGFSLAQQGRYAEAAACFEKAIELEPAFAKAHYNLALCLLKMGRIQEAAEHLEAAVRIKSDMLSARVGLDKVKHALATGETATVLPDESVEHYRRAVKFHSRGLIDKAIEEYRLAIRINPSFAQAHANLGLAYKDKGYLDAAIIEYREALKYKPDLAEAHGNLAVAMYFKGRYAEAWKHVRLCQKYGANPHPSFIEALSEKMPEP